MHILCKRGPHSLTMSSKNSKENDVESTETIILHPLAIVSMSSKFTRVIQDCAMDQLPLPDRIIGCLIGTIEGRKTDIHDVYEFPYEMKKDSEGMPKLEFTEAEDDMDEEEGEQSESIFDKCKRLGETRRCLHVSHTYISTHVAFACVISPAALEVHPTMDVVGWFAYCRKTSNWKEEEDLAINKQV